MDRYTKAIMAFFAGLGTWGATAGVDGHFSTVELFGLCGVVATAVGVYAVPNKKR